MKKIVIASLIAAPALALTACGGGGTTTENVTVSNDLVLNEGELAGDNFATDAALNETADAVNTAEAVTDNALEGASNVVGNAAE